MFKAIICGARDYSRELVVNSFLDGLYAKYGDELYIIEGGAKGADTIARDWVKQKFGSQYHKHHWRVDAKWQELGAYAGPDRNKTMLEEGEPNIVFGFKDDFNHKMDKGGTENMLKISAKAGIPTYLVQKIEG
jgi:hypothetical protein